MGMYCLVTLPCILAVLCYQATSLSSADTDKRLTIQHETWMAKHGRYYESKKEKEKRRRIFQDNLEHVERFNGEATHTYKLGMNQFADLTKQEFIAKHASSFRPSFKKSPTSFKYQNVQDVPPSFDWREHNAVTPVGSQGQCGCCWAFAAVGAIEGIAAIKTGNLTSLSEQQIMDCNGGHEGCNGGRMEHAINYVKENGGLASDADYPYQTEQRQCSTDKPSSLPVKITGYEQVPISETEMQKAVANQPLSIGIDPTLLQLYKSGILSGDCGKSLTHAVTAIGYGASEDGTKFWILKNSWGPNWGEKGYVRLLRDVEDKEGLCGIATQLVYPTV